MILLFLLMNPLQDFKVAKGLFDDGMYELAEKELKNFIVNYKDSEYAKEAALLYLKALYAQEKYETIIGESKKLILDYPENREEILIIKGKSEIKINRFSDAERTFNQLQDRKKKYSMIGDMYYGKGDYKNAIIYYQKLNDDYGNFSIGWCYYKLKRWDDAMRYFKMVKEKKYIEESEYMISKINIIKTGKTDELIKFLKNYPKSKFRANALLTLGEYYEDKNIQESQNYYIKVVNEKLEYSDYALYRIALNYFKSEKYDSSLYYFNLVEPTSKYFGDCLYYIARINSLKGEYDIAINLFKQVANDYKELREQSIFRIAEIYKKKGEIDKAVENFKIVTGELKTGANIEIGNIFLSKGQFDSALYYFSLSDDDKMVFLKSITYFKMGNYDEAISNCQKIIKRSKDTELVLKSKLLLGDTYLEKKSYDEAINFYTEVLNNNMRILYPSALEGLGWAYYGKKDYNAAFNYLDRLSKEFPDYQGKGKIFLTMGDIAYSMKDYERAIEYYSKVKGEEEPESFYKKGLVLFDKGDYTGSIKILNELRKKFPLYEKSDDALYLIALASRKANDIYASINNIRELLKMSVSKELKAKATLLLADNFFDQGRFDSSLYYYERYTYIFTQPQKEMVPGIRGIVYSVYKLRGEKEFENIINDYMRRYKETIIYQDIAVMFARLYQNIGNSKKAIELLEGINTIDSKIALLDVYKKTGNQENLIKLLNELLTDERTKEKASFELASYYFKRKEFSKAIEYSKNINKPDINYIYIMSLIENKKIEEALDELEKRNTEDYKELLKGIILIRKGDETGVQYLDNAMKNENTAPISIYEKAVYLIGKNKDNDAKEILLKMRYLYPESEYYSPSMIILSKILIKEGKKSEARKILEEIIARKDGYEKDAKAILDSIR